MRRIYLFLLACVICPLTVYSKDKQNSFVADFARQSLVIPQQLLLQKKQIPGLDLNRLVGEIQTIEWVTGDGFFWAGSGESRTGAIYFVRDRKVIVNPSREPYEPHFTRSVAALHEALGALGYVDENYELSALLYLNSFPDEARLKFLPSFPFEVMNQRFVGLARRSNDVLYAGTSVGGGGDGIAIQFKVYAMVMAHSITELFGYSKNGLYEKILEAKVEIQTQVTRQNLAKENREKDVVWLVPMVRWLNGNLQTREKTMSVDQLEILRQWVEALAAEARP